MEIGEELKIWLQDKSKDYIARLEFALKVWQSVDFIYSNKYEVICEWLADTLRKEANILHVPQLQQLFSLRAQPGLVSVETKIKLIKALIKRVEQDAKVEGQPQLLLSLLNFELVQDALRADYEVLMRCYGTVFVCYERELSVQQGHHSDFILPVLQQLRDYVQRAQDHKRLLEAYTTHALQPLCLLLIQLRQHGLCCFEQLAALEQQLTGQVSVKDQLKRLCGLPSPVKLLIYECALFNQQYDSVNQQKLIVYVFDKLVNENVEKKEGDTVPEVLPLALRTVETLRKHNITLQFSSKFKGVSPQNYLGRCLLRIARLYKEKSLGPLLQLLCETLRFNPLILEPHVYEITIWVLCAPKQSPAELQQFSDYMVLLLDMCRRLSRCERFIMELLKSLRVWLKHNAMPGENLAKRIKLNLTEESLVDNTTISGVDTLTQTWPSQVGAAFTRLVSQQMGKPSLVIWKKLLHSFDELLTRESDGILRVNRSFAIELQATLLCQYLLGTRLAEQVQQYQTDIQQQRQHTTLVLQRFGRYLLAREHNRQCMNAFLECVERASNFELLLAYYWPDGLQTEREQEELPQLHKFLTIEEWQLLQQRVHNFGKSACRQRLQRLELQLVKAGWLFLPQERQECCSDALAALLPPQHLSHLTREQKQLRLTQTQYSTAVLLEDAECVELRSLRLLQDYASTLKTSKIKGSTLCKQLLPELAENELALAQVLREQSASSKQPELPFESTEKLVKALQELPLSQMFTRIKSRLFLLIFSLFHDISRAQLTTQANQVLELLIDLLHFGRPLPVCNYFPQLEELLQLIPIEENDSAVTPTWRFYQTLFSRCIRRLGSGTEQFLNSCGDYFRLQLEERKKLDSQQCRLLLLSIETLSGSTGAQARRMQRHLQPLLEIYGQFVTNKFRSTIKPPSVYKEFVQQTLSGFAIYLSSCINRSAKQQQQKAEENAPDTDMPPVQGIDENLRQICKIYIGHSLNYRNTHAIRLLNVALTHRQQLHLDQDEIEFVLNSYWKQLNADINSNIKLDVQSIEPAIKLIIGYKTNEDFLLLLRQLAAQLDGMPRPETAEQHTSLQNVLILLTLCSKCSLSSIKGAMLNEYFELISGNVMLRLPGISDGFYGSHILRLLEAQRSLSSNRTVPLTGETLDCMLGSMLDMNIKRYIISGGNWTDFVAMHGTISENCLILLRQHGALMSDRAAQLTTLCQDLVQAIVCYRSERKQAQNLSEEELDGLSEIALKLVTLIAGIGTGSQALTVKRVAPFLLIFTIKQMVATDRPTTLYEKVKVHMDRICHELIGLCDHRAGHFILRACSEAGARMYQNLVKEHDKYHKFRGKI